jgi:hypothetical protein
MAQGQGSTATIDAPDTLPSDFFEKKAAQGAPDTLPADFFDNKPAAKPVPAANLPGATPRLLAAAANAPAAMTKPTQFEEERKPENQPGFLQTYLPGIFASPEEIKRHQAGESAADIIGARVSAPLREAPPSLPAPLEDDRYRREMGRSIPYRAVGAIGDILSPITGVQPRAMEEAADVGNARSILGQAAQGATYATAPIAAEGIGAIGGKVTRALEPRRINTFDNVVRDLAGKTPADLEFTKTLGTVRADIADVARNSGFAEKGNARVGEFQQMLDERAHEIWREEHQPQVERHAEMPINHEAIAERAKAAISPADRANNPAGARAADRWIDSALSEDAIGTIGKADDMLRRINAEIPNLPEPFKNIGKQVRNAAARGLRSEIETGLTSAEEAGVHGPNTRWGALREISNAVERKLNAAANKPLSAWDVARSARTPMVEGGIVGGGIGAAIGGPTGAAIGGGIGGTVGATGSIIHDIRMEPGGRIARAMRGLGKTSLQPETVGVPSYVGQKPAGLLTAGATPAGWTDTSGPIPAAERTEPIVWTPEMINAVARETPKPPPNVAGERTPIGTIQPIALGPFEPKAAYRGPQRPATVQRFPALPETVEGAERLPSETVKPMVKPRLTVEEKVKERLPQTEPVKAMEKPAGYKPSEKATTMSEAPKNLGPEFELDQLSHDVERSKAILDNPKATSEDKAAATERLNTARARVTEIERSRGVLPGMSEAVGKQAEGAARVKGEELTAEMNRPKNVEEAAGRMETLSPLFRGTAASPQGELLRPLEKPTVTEPEEEAEPAEIKGVTEPIKPAVKREAPPDVAKKYGRDEIEEAENLIRQEIGMMQSADKPGRYFDQSEVGDIRTGSRQIRGGDWRGVGSLRENLPWMKENPNFNPAQLEKALRNKDSALYKRAIDSAAQFIRREKMTPEEKAAAGETIAEKWKNFRPQPSKFLKTE